MCSDPLITAPRRPGTHNCSPPEEPRSIDRGWGGFKSFRKRVPINLNKMKVMVHDRHAIGDLSFFPAMGASGSQRNRIEHNVPMDFEEHMGDSDEASEDDSNDQVQLTAGKESRSPPRSVHTNAQKRRSVGGSSEYIRDEQDSDYFVIFDDGDISRYLRVRGMDDEEEHAIDTLILYTLVGSSSQQAPSSHQRLAKMIVEIVAISLYIFAKEASYNDA
ncbi:hypothetical protein Cgig2_011578 [Carnegiea gigantea]|uniref:Uncharacterized protein n=1 Tax=Carnegiea gigantea TaxID=171969 RepID=A0A9Q1K8B7_9CARY|nr:hypothetical protein Cgig2_011578 [Carnegiea gigantea]